MTALAERHCDMAGSIWAVPKPVDPPYHEIAREKLSRLPGQHVRCYSDTPGPCPHPLKGYGLELILLPHKEERKLASYYQRAFTSSTELYIVSAYLTNWEIDTALHSQCKRFRLIVGRDFGITRKAACQAVMRWLPGERSGQFMVADGIDGFHPKAMFWRETDGACYALVGSSNLSRAAFATNHEINGLSAISDAQFDSARAWVKDLEARSVVVSEAWLAEYAEAVPRRSAPKTGGGGTEAEGSVFSLVLPLPSNAAKLKQVLVRRRRQMKLFDVVRPELEALFRNAAASAKWTPARNARFYADLRRLWFFGESGSSFRAAGWEIRGKASDFRKLSASMVKVLDADEYARDDIVREEIDWLAREKVSTRKAVFSEMLCHFFPYDYHVLNRPVRDWLKQTGFSPPKRGTEGVRFLDAATKLRSALRRSPRHPARNLAELDAVIWLASSTRTRNEVDERLD